MNKRGLPYELTTFAKSDLREIIHYTIRQWGKSQAAKYSNRLEKAFHKIAAGDVMFHSLSARYPQVKVTRCEHHYIFYLQENKEKPCILAVLHERMDLPSRIVDRLLT